MQGHGTAPVVPFLTRLGTCSTSATCPCASVTMAHVSEAMALARRPAFIDTRNMTRSRAGERVVAREPSMARSRVGLTNFGLLALHGDPPVDRDAVLIRELVVKRRML